MRTPVQALWVGPRLSEMERLSIRSYLRVGHDVHLYLYSPCEGIPEGTTVLDAGAIVPQDHIARFKNLPNFSDWFRWNLLAKRGGWYSDLDSVCLRPLEFESSYVFAEGDCGRGKSRVAAGNVRMPPGCDLARWLVENCGRVDPNATDDFSAFGPTLLQAGINRFGLHRHVWPTWAFMPVPVFDLNRISGAVSPETTLPPECFCVHLYANCWRGSNLNPDARQPMSSLYQRLKRWVDGDRMALAFGERRKRVLVAVVTCGGHRDKAEAQYLTWVRQARSAGFDVSFFDGEFLGVCDSPYVPAITEKAQAIYRWAFDHGYSATLKCDDDTYLNVENLWVPNGDYAGIPCGPNDGGKAEFGFADYPAGTHPHVFASGGATWLSRVALALLVANLPICGDWTDDRWAGQTLAREGIRLYGMPGFFWYPKMPQEPAQMSAMTQLPTATDIYRIHRTVIANSWTGDPNVRRFLAPLLANPNLVMDEDQVARASETVRDLRRSFPGSSPAEL